MTSRLTALSVAWVYWVSRQVPTSILCNVTKSEDRRVIKRPAAQTITKHLSVIDTFRKYRRRHSLYNGAGACDAVIAADTTDVTDDADSDLDMPDDLLDPSDDEDRKRDSSASASADDKVSAVLPVD